MSIPSPADLAARRPAPKPAPPQVRNVTASAAVTPKTEETPLPVRPRLTGAEAIAPGKLTDKEHFRKFFLFGMRLSRMNGNARLVGHDLMWRASHATGRISPTLQPTSETLALATGLTTGQVDVALNTLHSRGWLYYRRLQEGPRAGTEVMVLAIPAATLEQIRVHVSAKPRDGYAR